MLTGTESSDDARISRHFDSVMAGWTEIFQEEPTRKQTRHGLLHTVSRLDRVYVNFPAVEVLDKHVTALTFTSVIKPGFPSDHIPVIMRMQPMKKHRGRTKILEWICTKACFPAFVVSIADQCMMPGDIGDRISQMKDVMHAAAERVKDLCCTMGAATVFEKMHWAMVAARTGRAILSDGAHAKAATTKLRKAFAALPVLVQFFQGDFLVNEQGLTDYITSLGARQSLEVLDGLIGSEERYNNKDKQKEMALRRSRLWAPMRKCASLVNVRRDDGTAAASAEESADILFNQWQPVFQEAPMDMRAARRFVPHIQKVTQEYEWVISFDEFSALVGKLGVSAPGPDGIPFSAWRHAGDIARDLLYELYRHIMDGGPVSREFNHSLLVFLAKGEEELDGVVVSRAAGDVRPLNLSNTDAKTIAKAMNCPLSAACSTMVDPSQRGFVRHRQLLDNIILAEGKALGFAIEGEDSASLVTFDFRAAFPSVFQWWLFFVLVHAEIPESYINAIRTLYQQNFAFIYFAGATFRAIHICRGIRQG